MSTTSKTTRNLRPPRPPKQKVFLAGGTAQLKPTVRTSWRLAHEIIKKLTKKMLFIYILGLIFAECHADHLTLNCGTEPKPKVPERAAPTQLTKRRHVTMSCFPRLTCSVRNIFDTSLTLSTGSDWKCPVVKDTSQRTSRGKKNTIFSRLPKPCY